MAMIPQSPDGKNLALVRGDSPSDLILNVGSASRLPKSPFMDGLIRLTPRPQSQKRVVQNSSGRGQHWTSNEEMPRLILYNSWHPEVGFMPFSRTFHLRSAGALCGSDPLPGGGRHRPFLRN